MILGQHLLWWIGPIVNLAACGHNLIMKNLLMEMKMIKSYGAHAQRALPRLEKSLHYIEHEEKDFPRRLTADKARIVREAIAEIKASTEKPALIYLNK